jgi:hypothetical protein
MTQSTLIPDWRKIASSKLNDEQVEVAFMRQAFSHVESKVAPILRDPFFLGFEVIDKNDASTNIAGIFVFRIGTAYLYAPVFFKNGKIKGGNILYDATNKLFVPLVPEWCNYFVGKHHQSDGQLVDNSMSSGSAQGLNFDNLEAPESITKAASEKTLEAWEDMKKEAKAPGKERLLTKFLKSEHGTKAFDKME